MLHPSLTPNAGSRNNTPFFLSAQTRRAAVRTIDVYYRTTHTSCCMAPGLNASNRLPCTGEATTRPSLPRFAIGRLTTPFRPSDMPTREAEHFPGNRWPRSLSVAAYTGFHIMHLPYE
ncbi:hypothetical protein PMIN06_007588 [Paraphaeosphaeria minitans]